ncbi:WD repeat-containing 49-like, partial [Paramuricea clavata]
IYDLSSKSEFLCQYRIRGLKSTPISLNFWSNPEQPNESILVFGDVAGCVNALIFCESTISLFDRSAQASSNQQDITLIVDIGDIAKGHYKNCRFAFHEGHTEWTRQVMYIGVLDCFISCATNYKNALVLGWMEKTKSTMRTTVFKISQGVNAFAYNEKLNLIATAGVNHHVLLWNPYVISKPVGVLRGHMQSVVAVKFIESRGQTISLSKDKVLRVWDTHLQVCLQRLSGIFAKGPEVSTVMYFDEERSTLLTAFNHRLSMMVMKPEVKDRIISHEHPVIAAIYNRKFNQVVSACVGSVVTMWMIDTGQKVKQFTNVHGNSEITTITQDASETRLFTGSTDGTVKIWDFNGHCHHVLVAGDGHPCDITEVLPLKRMILVVGWDRTLCVFRDSQLTSYYVHPSDWKGRQEHQDDIQCMSFIAPHTLVTASYDGELVLWNTSSEQAFRHLNCKARKAARANRRLRKLEQTGSALQRSRDTPQMALTPNDNQDENEANAGHFVNKLIFLDNRPPPAVVNEAANLISCGASGWVRFWNTNRNALVGEFIAHEQAGAITMAVDAYYRYLATGDGDGFVKVWNISEYCLNISGDEPPLTKQPPLHKQFQPHFDSITSIEILERFDSMLLLTSSCDCSVALWDIHGRQVGVFGQEEHWRIEDLPIEQPESDNDDSEHREDDEDVLDMAKNNGSEEHSGMEEKIPDKWDPNFSVSTWDHSILGKAYSEPRKQKRRRQQPQTRENKSTARQKEKNCTEAGLTYSSLDTKELSSVHSLHKPDFVNNPSKYFNDDFMDTSRGTPRVDAVPPITETISMRYDEKNLFPKYILDMEAKMKVTHAMASRGSRANTRAGASTRSKPSPAQDAGKAVHFKPPRRKLSPQAETPTEDRETYR